MKSDSFDYRYSFVSFVLVSLNYLEINIVARKTVSQYLSAQMSFEKHLVLANISFADTFALSVVSRRLLALY